MAAIEFVLSSDDISDKLKALEDPALKARILNAAGTLVTSYAQRAFDEPSLRPEVWKPRKKTKAKKQPTHPLLLKSGTMRQSIHHQLIGTDTVQMGTPVIYGATHQLGSEDGSIPARPFFPVKDDQLTGEVLEEIEDVVGILIGKAGGQG